MSSWLPAFACIGAAASACAFYLASRHCRWPLARGRRARLGAWCGLALAAASLWAWSAMLGVGAGLCAMLANWMLALVALPYAATFAHARRRRAAPGGA